MKYPFIIIAATLLLSNCRSYFAHNVISNAKYEAYCDTADIKPKANQVIISDGKNYYMELPRYRWKQRSIDFMEGVGGKLRTGERRVAVPGEKDLYKLPANYARYLTGQSKIKPKEVVLEYSPIRRDICPFPHVRHSDNISNLEVSVWHQWPPHTLANRNAWQSHLSMPDS